MARFVTTAYQPIPLPDYQGYQIDEMRRRATMFTAGLVRRHSVRDFDARPVPRDIIEMCLTAALSAPSGANHQPWHFSVIGDAALKLRIRREAEAEERAFYEGRAGDEWVE